MRLLKTIMRSSRWCHELGKRCQGNRWVWKGDKNLSENQGQMDSHLGAGGTQERAMLAYQKVLDQGSAGESGARGGGGGTGTLLNPSQAQSTQCSQGWTRAKWPGMQKSGWWLELRGQQSQELHKAVRRHRQVDRPRAGKSKWWGPLRHCWGELGDRTKNNFRFC